MKNQMLHLEYETEIPYVFVAYVYSRQSYSLVGDSTK